MKAFGGAVLFLDRADINTDEIIPAKYLTEISKEALGPHMLEDLKLDGFDPQSPAVKQSRVIVTRGNFGCGSSREHAPWALEANGITAVIAPSFARIFRQNMFNGGLMAIEADPGVIDRLFALRAEDAMITFDLAAGTLSIRAGGQAETFSFALSGFDRTLVDHEGWVGYAEARY